MLVRFAAQPGLGAARPTAYTHRLHCRPHQVPMTLKNDPMTVALTVQPAPMPPAAAGGGGAGRTAGDSKDPRDTNSTAPRTATRTRVILRKIQQFVIENFLVLSFVVAAVFAMAVPVVGKAVASLQVGDWKIVITLNNIFVFLVSGLTLKSSEMKALGRHWVAWVYGLACILLITPCLGFAMVRLPLVPIEFATGLAIFCAVPTTLGAGVAITAAAKGNQALAVFLTVVTNLVGIVSVPFILRLVLSQSGNITVDPATLVVRLIITVLVPTVLGKLLQMFIPAVQRWVVKYKTFLSLFSITNLAMIVWQTLSSARDILVQVPIQSVLAALGLSIAIHLGFLALNAPICKWVFRFPYSEGVAVLIMASQKSSPVAVLIITYMGVTDAQQGLLALPSILGQLAQIFIGSVLARYLLSRRRPDQATEALAPAR